MIDEMVDPAVNVGTTFRNTTKITIYYRRKLMSNNKYDQGMKVRRKVLGDAHVDRSLANVTDFDQDFQEFITETAWGSVWARPGLDLKTRHMITVAVLAALGRQHELNIHIPATRNTGITPEEMREVLLHVAVYAGVPAALSAFVVAKQLYTQENDGELSE
jgi:4-carboxymuconolactone decarboxylase